jgi:hypothetical protein
MKPPGEVNSGTTVAMLEITGLPNRTDLYFFAEQHVNDLGKLMTKHLVVSGCNTQLSKTMATTLCADMAFLWKIDGFNAPQDAVQRHSKTD